ncbi:MAG: porin [Capnocytophaga sp.]|nr:porin [Capnocytophaga sp.]
MKSFFFAISLLAGGVAMAQEDLQNQINQLRAELEHLKRTPQMHMDKPPMDMPPHKEMESPIHKKFNVFFNFQSSFDAITPKDQDTELGFRARQLRLEIRGDINDRIFYRFRHRLNRSNDAASLDNLARATDLMYAGFKLNDKFTLTLGKMCQAWGGFEFDLNPMNIYEYSDMVENMDNFMLGGMLTFAPNKNHEFNLQITDVRNKSFEDHYGNSTGIQASKAPLTYIFNWNGNFFKNNLLQTRWAIGFQNEAKNHINAMYTFGTKLNLSKFQVALDYMLADEELDRLKYTPLSGTQVLKDVTYNTFVLKAEYQPIEKLNIFAQGMYETAENSIQNNERTSLGYYAGVEYLPFKDQDLRFFLAYIGRKYDYKNNSSLDNYTNRISLGLMYRIKAF